MNGIGSIQTAICNGFQNAESAAANRQMADMNNYFNMQSAFQQCCCENRLATAGVQTTISQEAAATRAANQANTQTVMDKLCQLEMDNIKQNYENRIAGMQNTMDQLRTDNQALRFAASQGAQTSQILADNARQTVALEQYLNPTPIPAYTVANPNCCSGNFGCQCGAA